MSNKKAPGQETDGVPEKAGYNILTQTYPVPEHLRDAGVFPTSHLVFSVDGDESGQAKNNSESYYPMCCTPGYVYTDEDIDGRAMLAELPCSTTYDYQQAKAECAGLGGGARLCYQQEAEVLSEYFGLSDSCTDDTVFWTMSAESYDAEVTKVQALVDAMYGTYAWPLTYYPAFGMNIIQNTNDSGTSYSGINFYEAIFFSLFLVLGAGLVLGATWNYTQEELANRMYETQILTGVNGVLLWLVNFIWDYSFLLAAGGLYVATADTDKENVADLMIPWCFVAIQYLFFTYFFGLLMTRDQLSTFVMALGLASFAGIFTFIIVDALSGGDPLPKLINIDISIDEDGKFWDQGEFDKKSIWQVKFPFLLFPPTSYFYAYSVELYGSFLGDMSDYDERVKNMYTEYYLYSFAFTMFWLLMFVGVNFWPTFDLKPDEIQVSEDDLMKEYDDENVTADHTSKVFKDAKGKPLIAVKDVSFKAVPNRCMGVLGKNGAGKSTMMNMLSTWYIPTAGKTNVRGLSTTSNKNAIRDFIGICNQQNLYWHNWTAYQHLAFFGALRGVPLAELEDTITVFAQELKFDEHLQTNMHQLSGGNKRKVLLCASVIGKSKVLYLDEPSAGVDPFARDEMRNVLVQLKDERTILFTSHTMEEAEIMCDELVIMVKGEVLESGSVTELIQNSSTGYYFFVDTLKVDDDKKEEIRKACKAEYPKISERPTNKDELSFLVPYEYKLSGLFYFADKIHEDTECATIIESASLAQLFLNVVGQENNESGDAGVKIDVSSADKEMPLV